MKTVYMKTVYMHFLLSLPLYLWAAAAAGLIYGCCISRSAPEPITQFRSNLIWLLHYASSLPCLLVNRLQSFLLPEKRGDSAPHYMSKERRKPGVNHNRKSSLQTPVSSQKEEKMGECDRRVNLCSRN